MKKLIIALTTALLVTGSSAMAADFKSSVECIGKVTALSQMVAEKKIPDALAKTQTPNATKLFQLCAANKFAAAGALYSEIKTALKAGGVELK